VKSGFGSGLEGALVAMCNGRLFSCPAPAGTVERDNSFRWTVAPTAWIPSYPNVKSPLVVRSSDYAPLACHDSEFFKVLAQARIT
jgi:hypothetical protein